MTMPAVERALAEVTRPLAWACTAILLALVAAVVMLAGAPTPLRATVVFIFLLLGPGMALVTHLNVQNAWTELTVGVAASLALDTILATFLVEVRLWQPTVAVLLLGALAVAAGVAQISVLRRRSSPPSPGTARGSADAAA